LLNGSKENLILTGKEIKKSIHKDNSKYLSLGELKGGIDPAGADEHWKTANSALNRIKRSFMKISMSPRIFFIGAAIEQSMAEEIFKQLKNNELSNAANLHKEKQLIDLCNWLLNE
jgi:type II restriction enzyme